jgi:hypothetical protein
MKKNYIILFKSETSPEWQEFFGTEQEAILEATTNNRHLNYNRNGYALIEDTRNQSEQVWICHKHLLAGQFEFQGVFSTEEKAISACIDYNYGIGPANLDEQLPDETTKWEGFYYPNLANE